MPAETVKAEAKKEPANEASELTFFEKIAQGKDYKIEDVTKKQLVSFVVENEIITGKDAQKLNKQRLINLIVVFLRK